MNIQIIEKLSGLHRLMSAAHQIELPTITRLAETIETVVARAQCETLNFANVSCLIAYLV